MPPKKRALTEADSNVQPPSKRTSTGGKDDKTKKNESSKQDQSAKGKTANDKASKDGEKAKESTPELPDDHFSKRPPHEYICMDKAFWFGASNASTGEKTDMFNKLASDHPDWPYTIMVESYSKIGEWIRRGKYTDPDLFDMYIYNDFHGYGLVELLENLLVEFNKAFGKKDVQAMWCVTATMGHWLNHDEAEAWLNIDDGERTERIFEVVGCMLLTALAAVEKEGELKADSKFRDLGLVMALFIKCAIFPAQIPLENGLEWRKDVVGYAKLAGIDLAKVGVEGMEKPLKEWSKVKALPKKDVADRWSWKKKFGALKKDYSIGGKQFDITAMSRQQRAAHAFDKKDPLADVPAHVLKEGLLDWA